MAVALISREQRWFCPNCANVEVTHEPRPHTRFHVCPGLRGLTAPMLPAGTKAHVYAVEREDYIGKEKVQTDVNGRPVMAVRTVRDEGEDAIVFAPRIEVRVGENA
jgi:hypothetical protein